MSKVYQKAFSQYAQKLPITLSDLDNWEYSVGPSVALKEVVKELESNPEIPGVLVCDQNSLLGIISRNTCFEKLSRPFSLDLFLQKPVGDLLSHFSTPYELFKSSTLIQEAVPHVLSRPSKLLYEPVVIQFDEHTFRLINVHDLLLAQNQLLVDSNFKIMQQVMVSRALASTLEISPLLEMLTTTIEEIIPHSKKIIMIKEDDIFQIQTTHQIDCEINELELNKKLHIILSEINLSEYSAIPMLLPSSKVVPEKNIWCEQEDISWVIFPLIHSGDLLAVFVIGRSRDPSMDQPAFEVYEIDHLFTNCPMFATALRNSQLYKLVQLAALIDPMTNVFNRRGLFNQNCISAEKSLSVIMIDIDHFKQINDTYGHLVGDRFIKDAAHIFQSVLRPTDKIGRYGGDEFVILLEDTDLLQSVQIAERIRERVYNHNDYIEGKPLSITVSMGVVITQPFETMDAVLARADQQLYKAKIMGRNQVCFQDVPALSLVSKVNCEKDKFYTK
jgi:diguanylate cyclase (GGDEF)-like protein